LVWVPGGAFMMGSDRHYPEEGPAHKVHVDGFWMDRYEVTNHRFAEFVRATGYITVAERVPQPEDYPGVSPSALVSGSAVFRQPTGPVALVNPGLWWAYAPGASWRCPEGPDSSIDGRDDHPVVHVCYEDAAAFARWNGQSLPTEAQWERAARGGLEECSFCWGEEFAIDGEVMANVWLGEFPWQNRKPREAGTEPVGSYPPNRFGLFDMAGNVWEWTTDFFHPGHAEEADRPRCCCPPRNPAGPASALTEQGSPAIPLRVLKGGSFLCAENYCLRYRPAARIPYGSDSGAVHIGFRCVRTAVP
jgi:formylglycine-generating enzyme required for sulfatase activity